MGAKVTSVFLYVNDVTRSIDFYNEVVGAQVTQIHVERRGRRSTWPSSGSATSPSCSTPGSRAPPSSPTPVPGPASISSCALTTSTPSISIASTSGRCSASWASRPTSPWGWREFALKDPDGYVWSIYEDKSGGQWT